MAKQAKATQATVAVAVAAAPAATAVYVLSAPALALAATAGAAVLTLQTPAKGTPQWRSAQYKQPNTRAGALAAIAALPQPVTLAAAQAALKGLPLGTGTPRSYIAAFVKNGYLAPATAA